MPVSMSAYTVFDETISNNRHPKYKTHLSFG